MNFLIEFILFINLFPFLRSNQSLLSWKDMSRLVSSFKPIHPSICQFKVENCHQTFAYAQQYDTYCNFYSRLRDCYRPLFDDMQCLSSELEKTYRIIRQNEYDACNNYPLTRSVFVHKFRVREKPIEQANSNESKTYECLCIGNQNLGARKPILKLKVSTRTLHRVFALSDSSIQILDSDNLQFIPNIKLKNIATFSILSSPDQHIDICVSTRRNKVQIYRLDKTNLTLFAEIPIQDAFTSITMDDRGILACTENEYFSYVTSTVNDRRSIGTFNSILKLDDPNTRTCFTNISSGQYLLNGPNVGVPTSLQGMSQRAPIMFVNSPENFLYSHPYLIVLTQDSIQIYSYLDDQLKQEIPLKTCRTLTNLQQDNIRNIIATNKDNIYILEQLSLDEQIEQLLNSYRLQEALILAESSCTTTKQRQTSAIVKSTKKRIGLIEFGAMNVVRALTLFDEVQIDFHELIGQISGFSPLTSPWNDIDETLKNQYNQWLNAFCDYMIKHSLEFSRQSDYYPSLLKAYVLVKSREFIIEFIEKHVSHIPIDYCPVLIHAHCYHAAALLYSIHDEHQQAIDIWKKLSTNEYSEDETFPGIWFLAKYILERHINRTLEFQTAEWLLERNEDELALKIFTGKHQSESSHDPFSSNRVINAIKTHSNMLVAYLEQAVFKLKLETDQIHTTLVNIYLDQILSKSATDTEEIRSKLQAFIITSNSYRVQTVLHRISSTNKFRREVALLYGKMNNFDQAFRILVDELADFEYAENYCLALSQGKSSGDRRIVAHVLFKILLSSLEKHPTEITEALLRLLCNTEIEFDFIEVFQHLPAHWSLASLSQILVRALRTYSYQRRSNRIESSLVRVENQRLKIKLNQLKSTKILIKEQTKCKYCHQLFYETSCVIYRDGSQVHIHCAKNYQKQN